MSIQFFAWSENKISTANHKELQIESHSTASIIRWNKCRGGKNPEFRRRFSRCWSRRWRIRNGPEYDAPRGAFTISNDWALFDYVCWGVTVRARWRFEII